MFVSVSSFRGTECVFAQIGSEEPPKGKFSVNLAQMLPPGGSIWMGVYSRDHPSAPGLSAWWERVFELIVSEEQTPPGRQAEHGEARVYLTKCICELILEGQLPHQTDNFIFELVSVNNKLPIL